MIQTSSELPKCLLSEEDDINDYDFVLYHTYLKDKEYREHYLKKRKSQPERMMILDNSAYEFFISGEQFNEDDYVKVINELVPDYYIVPDELMNKDATLKAFNKWIKTTIKKINKKSRPYFTPQGRTYYEFNDCLWQMIDTINAKKLPRNLCIPFHNDFYKDMDIPEVVKSEFGDVTGLDNHYAAGRITLLSRLSFTNAFNGYRIHLLGSHNPKEIKFIKRIPAVKTMDSGYPVKLGIEGIRLGEEKEKPKTIIDDFYNKDLDENTKNLIKTNVKTMRGFGR